MRVGYAKLGRSLSFDPGKWGFQGDAEAPNLLMRLARRNPAVEWVVIGKNSGTGWNSEPNISNPWVDQCRGQPYNNVSAQQTPPPGVPFIPYRNSGGGFWVNRDAYERDVRIAAEIEKLDGAVIHVGQHGTSHVPIPQSNSTWENARRDPSLITAPQLWARNYGEYLVRGLNALGDRSHGLVPIIYIITDPRNYLKARDVKWPTGTRSILSQYQYERTGRHERYLDPREPWVFIGKPSDEFDLVKLDRHNQVWVAQHRYVYGGLELMILPDDWKSWGPAGFHQRLPAGIASTSFSDGRIGREPRRSELIRDYLLSNYPDAEVFGKWDKKSLTDVPEGTVVQNKPDQFPELLNRWRVTLSLPALGSSWTVSKVYQCFAARVVCFMVDRLDDQGWLLPSLRRGPDTVEVAHATEQCGALYSVRDDWTARDIQLARWLRVNSPTEFGHRAAHVNANATVWEWLVDAQRDLLERRWNEHRTESMIESMLGLDVVGEEMYGG